MSTKKEVCKNILQHFIFFLISRENKKHSPTYHLVILPWVAEKICREMLDPEKKLVDWIRWIFYWGVSGGGIGWTFVIGGVSIIFFYLGCFLFGDWIRSAFLLEELGGLLCEIFSCACFHNVVVDSAYKIGQKCVRNGSKMVKND